MLRTDVYLTRSQLNQAFCRRAAVCSGLTTWWREMPSNKPQLNMRVSPEAVSIMKYLSKYYGLSMVGVLELLVREKAKELGISGYAKYKPPKL